jgi:hypothetical protein
MRRKVTPLPGLAGDGIVFPALTRWANECCRSAARVFPRLGCFRSTVAAPRGSDVFRSTVQRAAPRFACCRSAARDDFGAEGSWKLIASGFGAYILTELFTQFVRHCIQVSG